MTQDYGKNLLDYITDRLQETTPTTDEIIKEESSSPYSKWKSFIPSYWQNFRFEGMVAGNELTSNLSVLYGGYIDSDGNPKGIILLVNDKFEPVKTIYKYTSGTDLRYIQYMKQADDGTFYFIDDTAFSYTQKQQTLTSEKRFVMINNITVPVENQYICNLRASYILPNNLKNFYCHNMFKDPNSAHYVFFGGGADNTTPQYDYRLLKIWGLEVKVGEPNVWTSYVSQNLGLFGSAYAQFDNEGKVFFRCVWTNIKASSRDIRCYTKTYSGNPTDAMIMQFNYHPYIDEGNQKKQSVFMNIDEVYFVQNNQYWGISGTPNSKYIGLYKHNFSIGNNITIFEKYLGNYDYTYQEYIMIDKNQNELYVEYVNNYDLPNRKADYHIQRLENNVWNPILVGEGQFFISDRRSIFAKNNFNLVQIYSYAINPQAKYWNNFVIKEDYYSQNYNGEFYQSPDLLVPKKVELWNNSHLTFARNLYNVSKQNNMTMSSVEIPNNYLNEETITQSDLLSETNLKMNSNLQNWTKNIYEVVDLNFLNTISVIDEDTGDTYLNSAIKINNAITDGGLTNYQNTPCNKYRINYVDNTTSIKPLYWSSIDNLHRETVITFYVDKAIKSIDLLSNDETTVYLNLPVEVEVGNYYTLKEKVRIGE